MIVGAVQSVSARPGVRQLAKFCIVGASSFAIDFIIFNSLLYGAGLPVLAAKAVSFLCSVANGFYWNRKWTFRASAGDVRKQYPLFVATNTVGLMLNLSIMTGAILLASRAGIIHTDRTIGETVTLLISGQGKHAFPPLTLYGAIIVATFFVMAWNFTAARLWTFRQHDPMEPIGAVPSG